MKMTYIVPEILETSTSCSQIIATSIPISSQDAEREYTKGCDAKEEAWDLGWWEDTY